MTRVPYVCSVAFSWGGDVHGWTVAMSERSARRLGAKLAWLQDLGHVAAFSLQCVAGDGTERQIEHDLRVRLGDLVMDAIEDQPPANPPAEFGYLVPVSTFQPGPGGSLVAIAKFVGLEVEVTAVPSCDEEVGFPLPGRTRLYLPQIAPFS